MRVLKSILYIYFVFTCMIIKKNYIIDIVFFKLIKYSLNILLFIDDMFVVYNV